MPSRFFSGIAHGQAADARPPSGRRGVDARARPAAPSRPRCRSRDASPRRAGCAAPTPCSCAGQRDVVGVAAVALSRRGSSTRRTGWATPNLVMGMALRAIGRSRSAGSRRRPTALDAAADQAGTCGATAAQLAPGRGRRMLAASAPKRALIPSRMRLERDVQHRDQEDADARWPRSCRRTPACRPRGG